MIHSGLLHQVVGRGPVAVTIEQRPDNPATQHSRKSFLISLRLESGDDFIALRKASNVQALLVRRATTKARIVWRVSFLNTFFVRVHQIKGSFLAPSTPWREKTISRKGVTQSQEAARWARNCSRNLYLCTLPVAVCGNSEIKISRR